MYIFTELIGQQGGWRPTPTASDPKPANEASDHSCQSNVFVQDVSAISCTLVTSHLFHCVSSLKAKVMQGVQSPLCMLRLVLNIKT